MMERYVASRGFYGKKKDPIPKVTVSQQTMRFNKSFEDRYLNGSKSVRLYWDRKNRVVWVKPMTYHKSEDLRITKTSLSGSSKVSAVGFLRRYGLTRVINGNRKFKVWDNPTGEGAFFQLA